MNNDVLLQVRNLIVRFQGDNRIVQAVQEVSFTLDAGRTLALVGESGSGKSLTALSITQLLPGGARIASGQILLEGLDLLGFDEASMRRIRGRRISMIFQDPMSSLNPVYTVGDQLAETIRSHQRCSSRHGWSSAVEALRNVGISDPAHRAREYPHQLSGGMQQRVMIALALACRPALLIADEPTSALDVTVQAQILTLLHELQEQTGVAILLITHDFGVVAEMADSVCVMHHGMVVEQGTVQQVFDQPKHDYTRSLIASALKLEGAGPDRT